MARIIVIGGGIAGYTAALGLAHPSDTVTLIEKDTLGGTCLNRGCIPTKLFLHDSFSGKKLSEIASHLTRSVSTLRGDIGNLLKQKNVRVVSDSAVIESANMLVLSSGEHVEFDTLVIATGSEPIVPTSLAGAPQLYTSDSIFQIPRLPRKLFIVGGGYIGVELAHIFHALGSSVTIIEREARILPTLDPDAASVISNSLLAKGVDIMTDKSASWHEGRLLCGEHALEFDPASDAIVVSVGRAPVVPESRVTMERDRRALKVDGLFRTSQQNIYAIGDCAGGPLFAHKAEYDAELLAHNLRNGLAHERDWSLIPWCVYGEPQAIGIGSFPPDCRTVKVLFNMLGRAYCDDSTEGFLKLAVKEGKIVGALAVNKNALELLGALTVIVQKKMDCSEVAHMVFSHPTTPEIIRIAAKRCAR